MSRDKQLDGRDSKTGQFIKGYKGGPGRKPGSRNAISEDFLRSLHAEWQRSGDAALADVAKNRPDIFCRIVAGLLPREVDIDQALTVNVKMLAERNFAEAYAFALQTIGSQLADETEGNIEVFWPYSAEPDPVNIRAAQASAERKLNRWRKVSIGLGWAKAMAN